MATEVKDEEDVVDGIELVLLLLEFNVIEAVEVLLTGVLVVADGDGGGRAATGGPVLWTPETTWTPVEVPCHHQPGQGRKSFLKNK